MKTTEVFKLNFHSVVDVITNSSTVIYTYQDGCEAPAKELIDEMLKLSGETEKKADDIFYFGVFCETDHYTERINEDEDEDDGEESDFSNIPRLNGEWGTDEHKASRKAQLEWVEALQLSIMKGDIEKPKWMERAEEGRDYGWNPDTYLVLVPREDKYAEFGRKISDLLNGISADGGRDG